MKINYLINNEIPQGAWFAKLNKGSSTLEVEIGSSVFHTDQFFVFGVWDGSLSSGDFDDALFACCSGANVKKCKQGG